MIDGSLFQSNFVGRDGFRWWIGQVPPVSAQGAQANGAGWGNRVKVRIMGYHPYSEVELPNEDLPWAQCLLPTTSGTGAGNNATNIKIHPGDVVFGFFLDGDNAQTPVIMGCFGRTSQVPSKTYQGAFQPFTGYTDKIKNDGSRVKKNESNEQNAAAQKSPRHVSPTKAKQIGSDEISYFSAIGETINFASASSSSAINKISTEVDNLIKRIQNLTSDVNTKISSIQRDINLEIDKITAKIQKIASGVVGPMVNNLYKKMAPILNKGLKVLYKTVYTLVFAITKSDPIAHKAGVAAQEAMVPPVKALQNLIPCIANSVLNGLGGIIKSILKSVVANVANFVSCVSSQVIGSLLNQIIGGISSGLSSAMQAVSKIAGGFDVANTLRNNIEGIGGLIAQSGCNEVAPNFNSSTNEWVIGKGAKNAPGVPFSEILSAANTANSIAQSAISLGQSLSNLEKTVGSFGFMSSDISSPASALSACYAGPPLSCAKPTINIFGSEGKGATAIPILGSIVGSGREATGSIIGVQVTNSGSGYDFPPFVEIVDNCNKGYGAVARSIIDENGQVISIYIVSEGENYPVGDQPDYIVATVDIIDPGNGYTNQDTIRDNLGNIYTFNTIGGRISSVSPINTPEPGGTSPTSSIVTDLPIITIESETGSGAILKASLGIKPSKPQGEIKQVIDCVG
jgi:outer membrane murein-binding lipoprotein Lpp